MTTTEKKFCRGCGRQNGENHTEECAHVDCDPMMENTHCFVLSPECPEIRWCDGLKPIGEEDPFTRLYGHIKIAGADFHVDAWQVEETSRGEQVVVDVAVADRYDYITGNMTEGPGETIEIFGRSYFIVISPFQL